MINVSCRIINLGIIKHLRIKKPPSWKSRDLSSSCFVTIRESRSETGWDLGPWNNCINVQLEEILDKKIKKKKTRKTHLPLLKSREQKQCWEQKQCTAHALCTQHNLEGWAKHLSHPSGSFPEHTHTLTPLSVFPLLGEWAKEPPIYLHSLLWLQGFW